MVLLFNFVVLFLGEALKMGRATHHLDTAGWIER